MNGKQAASKQSVEIHLASRTQGMHDVNLGATQISSIVNLQNQIGNHGVQRLLAQRRSDSPSELDNETAGRINRARGGGMTLDTMIQKKMSEAMGHDFSDVRVHTSHEGHELSQQLSAKAFTTGRDIFFREGAYSPQTSSGQELLAHELTHVVQQSGSLTSVDNGPLAVNAPNDQFEKEANRIAKGVIESTQAQVASNGQNVIQRQVVCDPENPEICWSAADTFTPASEPNMSYQSPVDDSNSLDQTTLSTPLLSISPDPAMLSPSQDNGWETFNNPIWHTVTNNAVSGATGLFEAVNPIAVNMPKFGKALTNLGGMKGWEAALKMEDALSLPASKLPGVFGPSGSIAGSRLPMGMSRASSVLAPLGVISNALSFEDAIARPGSWLEKSGDAASSAAGFFSSSVGTMGLVGAGLEAAGTSSILGGTALGGTLSTAGGALSTATGAAGLLGSAAAVAGSAAGGYAVGRLIDEATGGLMNVTGASDAIDSMRGITRPEGEQGDYSISGMGANVATAADKGTVEILRSMGMIDKSKPAYTQTLGWNLGEWFGI